MQNPIEIEDIEEMRRENGIEDIQLRVDIRALKAGDFVKLTLLGPAASETRLVRITSVKGSTFRGKLADKPRSKTSSKLPAGAPLVFEAAHIHSISKASP